MLKYDKLLAAISETGNLSRACRSEGISKSTFLRDVEKDEALADQYARARAEGFDAEADAALDEALSAEDAGLGRLALDARKWYLSKLAPKKYGDKTLIGSDPANPLPSANVTIDMSKLSADALREIASLEPDA